MQENLEIIEIFINFHPFPLWYYGFFLSNESKLVKCLNKCDNKTSINYCLHYEIIKCVEFMYVRVVFNGNLFGCEWHLKNKMWISFRFFDWHTIYRNNTINANIILDKFFFFFSLKRGLHFGIFDEHWFIHLILLII